MAKSAPSSQPDFFVKTETPPRDAEGRALCALWPECKRPVSAKGLCKKDYNRWREGRLPTLPVRGGK